MDTKNLRTGKMESMTPIGTYKGHQIITVILHANGDNKDNRFIQTQNLYKILKNDYHLQNIKLPNDVINTDIKNGTQDKITTYPEKLTIWSNKPLTTYTVSQNFNNKLTNNIQTLQAPVKQGQCIGSIRLTISDLKTVSGEPLTYPLYSNENVQRGNLFDKLFR